jgi:hypothetical protein
MQRSATRRRLDQAHHRQQRHGGQRRLRGRRAWLSY